MQTHKKGEAKLPIKYDKLAQARSKLQAGNQEVARTRAGILQQNDPKKTDEQ